MGCENLSHRRSIEKADHAIRSNIIQTIADEPSALDVFHRMNWDEKRRAACNSLESYVLVVRHAIQKLSHRLTEQDRQKALAICDLTIEWLKSEECTDQNIDIDSLNSKILDVLHIFQPILRKLFKRSHYNDCGLQAGPIIRIDPDHSTCH